MLSFGGKVGGEGGVGDALGAVWEGQGAELTFEEGDKGGVVVLGEEDAVGLVGEGGV